MTKFWTNALGVIKLDPDALFKFLEENGFGLLESDSVQGNIVVRSDDHIIRTVNTMDIRKYCLDFVASQENSMDPMEMKQIRNLLITDRTVIRNENIPLLQKLDVREIEDEEDISYIFFKNCILIINEDGVQKVLHEDIPGHCYKSDIINFDLAIEDMDREQGLFKQFIQDISSHGNPEIAQHNYLSLVSIIGYMLHRYKDPSNPRALILLDPFRGEGSNGGSGKSLLTQSFQKIRSTVFQDGKRFHLNERFSLSNVEYDTRILVIDDVPDRFDFSKLFPLISERAVVEKKYQDKTVIGYDKSPKIVLTSNFTIDSDDESSKRRKVEFILSDVFKSDYKPIDRYGQLLFDGWSKEEWENFYVLMARYISFFLKNGIIIPRINVAERALKISSPPKFIEYADNNFKTGIKYNKSDVYDDFYAKNPDVFRISMTGFHIWLSLYAQAYGYKMTETHSNSSNFFQYSLE